MCNRRFRILCVADTSQSGVLVVRGLMRLIGMRSKPDTGMSDNGTELTSSANQHEGVGLQI
jgi:hypothetical protein